MLIKRWLILLALVLLPPVVGADEFFDSSERRVGRSEALPTIPYKKVGFVPLPTIIRNNGDC
jgi:hypothetical protein